MISWFSYFISYRDIKPKNWFFLCSSKKFSPRSLFLRVKPSRYFGPQVFVRSRWVGRTGNLGHPRTGLYPRSDSLTRTPPPFVLCLSISALQRRVLLGIWSHTEYLHGANAGSRKFRGKRVRFSLREWKCRMKMIHIQHQWIFTQVFNVLLSFNESLESLSSVALLTYIQIYLCKFPYPMDTD